MFQQIAHWMQPWIPLIYSGTARGGAGGHSTPTFSAGLRSEKYATATTEGHNIATGRYLCTAAKVLLTPAPQNSFSLHSDIKLSSAPPVGSPAVDSAANRELTFINIHLSGKEQQSQTMTLKCNAHANGKRITQSSWLVICVLKAWSPQYGLAAYKRDRRNESQAVCFLRVGWMFQIWRWNSYY